MHRDEMKFLLFLGEFLVFILGDGRLIRWKKDVNQVRIISACPEFDVSGKG